MLIYQSFISKKSGQIMTNNKAPELRTRLSVQAQSLLEELENPSALRNVNQFAVLQTVDRSI